MRTRTNLIVILSAAAASTAFIGFYASSRGVAQAAKVSVVVDQASAPASGLPDPERIRAVALAFGLGLSIATLESAGMDANEVAHILSNAAAISDADRVALDTALHSVRRERVRAGSVKLEVTAPIVMVAIDSLLAGTDPAKAASARGGAIAVLSGTGNTAQLVAGLVQADRAPSDHHATAGGRPAVAPIPRASSTPMEQTPEKHQGFAHSRQAVAHGLQPESSVARAISDWCEQR